MQSEVHDKIIDDFLHNASSETIVVSEIVSITYIFYDICSMSGKFWPSRFVWIEQMKLKCLIQISKNLK